MNHNEERYEAGLYEIMPPPDWWPDNQDYPPFTFFGDIAQDRYRMLRAMAIVEGKATNSAPTSIWLRRRGQDEHSMSQ